MNKKELLYFIVIGFIIGIFIYPIITAILARCEPIEECPIIVINEDF